MGHIAHDMVIVTASDYFRTDPNWPDVNAFRESMPEEFRHLVVGPIKSVTNGFVTFVFAPDGSKTGWDTDQQGDDLREAFIDLFSFRYDDGSSPFDVVRLQYGGDMRYDTHGGMRAEYWPLANQGSWT